MKCDEIKFGTYDCAYNIMLPYLVTDPTEPGNKPQPKTVAVDKCLLPEILKLWEMGIKTTGCCCGHGRKGMSFIGVRPEYIDKMKSLGYEVHFNECRPGDEDEFIPKTRLLYSNADKGFNWWDKQPTIIPEDHIGDANQMVNNDYAGLKVKYIVRKASNGELVDDCFVLRPDKDQAAIAALNAYADATENQVLAADIRKWLSSIISAEPRVIKWREWNRIVAEEGET